MFIDDADGRLTRLRFTATGTASSTSMPKKDTDTRAETLFARAAREPGIECIRPIPRSANETLQQLVMASCCK